MNSPKQTNGKRVFAMTILVYQPGIGQGRKHLAVVPGVDLVPFWTLAVINVYRKWKQITITTEEARDQRPALKIEHRGRKDIQHLTSAGLVLIIFLCAWRMYMQIPLTP
jgi:hypothetical protein